MVIKRSPTTTETSEQLHDLTIEIRRIAAALQAIRARSDGFSKPVYDAGWKFPLASMLGFACEMEEWAEALDLLVDPSKSPA